VASSGPRVTFFPGSSFASWDLIGLETLERGGVPLPLAVFEGFFEFRDAALKAFDPAHSPPIHRAFTELIDESLDDLARFHLHSAVFSVLMKLAFGRATPKGSPLHSHAFALSPSQPSPPANLGSLIEKHASVTHTVTDP